MTALLLNGYVSGLHSSRRIAKACTERADFMMILMIVAGDPPDFRTVSDFRKRHLQALKQLFLQVLALCAAAGLVKLGHVALDGTKIRANASKHKALSYARMKQREAELQAEVERCRERTGAADEGVGLLSEEDQARGSEWLYGALVECRYEMVCIEVRHAHRFLSSRPNKTDRNDARGIADMMRLGHFKPVHVKSRSSQLMRTMLAARKTFVDHMIAMEQAIRGYLKVYWLKVGAVHRCAFAAKVEALLAELPELRAAVALLLEARKKELDAQLEKQARKDPVCKRLMTIPGVGPIISLAYKATIDDPERFKASKAVPAHLGLTPRIYQSGETDRSGHISKCGDRLLRHSLYEAATRTCA